MKTILILAMLFAVDSSRDNSLVNQAERDRDRGVGRVVDPQTHELDQIQRDRQNPRPITRIEEDLDRQQTIERNAQKPSAQSPQTTTPLPAPGPVLDERQQKMEAPRQDLLRDIQQAIESRDAALRENPTPEARTKIEATFQAALTNILHRYDITWRSPVGPVPTQPTHTNAH